MRVRKDLSSVVTHTETPVNSCCGYVGVLLGPVVWHQHWFEGQAHVLIIQEVQCPKCGAKGLAKATAIAEQHWPDVDEGASKAEQAFAIFAAEQQMRGAAQ